MAKCSVILVDDELLFKEGMKMILGMNDIDTVDTAANGQELIDLLDKGIEADVILMDLSMPVLDGVDTLKVLKNKKLRSKTIILSSYYNDNIIIQLLDEGASGFLAKNEDPKIVVETVLGVAEKGFHINDYILQLIRNKRLLAKDKKSQHELTPREEEIMLLICEQYTNQEIADKIHLSKRTVEGHRNRILDKTGAKNTVGLVIYAIEHNIYNVNISKYN